MIAAILSLVLLPLFSLGQTADAEQSAPSGAVETSSPLGLSYEYTDLVLSTDSQSGQNDLNFKSRKSQNITKPQERELLFTAASPTTSAFWVAAFSQ